MNNPLNILIVEDSKPDAELLVARLESSGYALQWTRVETEPAYVAALEEQPDLIFSDFSLPQFSTNRALKILHDSGRQVPFIIVSGTIGEERAVESLRAGATDYVLKDRLERLPYVVQRAIREAQERQERQRAEETLKESERRFREMLENMHLIAITMDKGGNLTFCNDFLLRLTGWIREEVIGRNWFSRFVPDTFPQAQKMFFDNINSGNCIAPHYENPIKTRDGLEREIVWNNTMLRDAFGNIVGSASIGQDVTEQRAAEKALRESEQKFRQLAENIHVVFWLTDVSKNEMLYVSPAYEKIWGRPCETLYQQADGWIQAVHPEDRERIFKAVKSRQPHGHYDETYRILRPDGSERWIHDRAFPIRARDGKVYRIVGTAEDITRQRELEEQMRQSQKLESIGRLASGVAHDFNNLLTVINCCSQYLLDSPDLSSDATEMVKEIYTAGERAANLTRQLLTFSRKQAIRTENLSVNEVIDDVAKMLQRLIGEDIELKLELAEPLPEVVADSGMLEQVLMNLAVNARDAMPKGGQLGINTRLRHIDDQAAQTNTESRPGTFVCMSVRDSGCGMPPEVLSRIFEPFFTTKELGKGTGLGLATVFGIVKQHNGWIEVETAVNEGTTFHVFLPVTEANVRKAGEKSESPQMVGGSETILLVEDDETLRGMAVIFLQKYGYHVLEATTGPEALKIWKENGGKVDLLLADVVLPGGMTGSDLAEQLRNSHPALKTIYTSGYSSSEMPGLLNIARDKLSFLQKPYNPQQLVATIREQLARN